MELLDNKIKKDEDVAWRIIEGEALLVSPKTSHIFPLDDIGTRIWSVLEGDLNGRQIARLLEGEYDSDLKTIESDLGIFIEELIKNNLACICG